MLIPHIAPHRDFLSDDDAHTPAASPPLQDRSAEIGNVKNQLQSTTRSLEAAKQERDALEQTLASQAAQLSTIQTQLSLAKASYDTETNLLAALKERRAGQVADIDNARHELINAESNLSALRAEKAEIEGAFLRDKEEARDLHKRMVEAGQQAESLKTDVEKLKKEAKQQKGLLAIARKQLSTKEAERAKAEKEHEEAVAEVAAIAEEKQTVDANIERLDATPLPVPIPKVVSPSPSASLMLAAAQPLPTTPEISSPVSTKSNNPFERLAMTSSPPLQSPSSFLGLANTVVSSPPISVTEAAPQQVPAEAAPVEVAKEEPSAFDDFASSFGNQGTELSYLGDDLEASQTQEVASSPGTATSANEFFSTPPTSAFNEASPPLNALERFPSLHDVTTVLPTEKVPTPAPAANGAAAPAASANPQTDLTAQLKELDIEESDSEDEIDSDDEPLYKKSAIANGKARAVDPVPVAEKEAPAPVPVASAPAPASVAAGATTVVTASFEDVFGSSEPPALEAKAAPNGYTTPFDLSASPFAQPAAAPIAKPIEESVPVAGVDEFDAALGKLGNSTSATPVNFSFESSFDDTFDFSSNSQPPQPLVSQAAPSTGITQKNDFDSLFGASAPASFAPPPAIPSFTAPVAGTNKVTSSFEEAFGGFDMISAPKLDVKAEKPTSPAFMAETMPGSFPSSPTQSFTAAATKPRVSDIRAASPSPRAKSPPPRTTSPAPRASSSSNKDAHDKPKEAPTRHSKLSVSHSFVASFITFLNITSFRSVCRSAGKRNTRNLYPLPLLSTSPLR